MIANLPADEEQRLRALQECDVLDTPPEASFDDITRMAARLLGAPISLVSLVDETRQWFKSHHGLAVAHTPRAIAFCAHAILQGEGVFEVADARADPRFADNPLVTSDPFIRFYAGVPLVLADGRALGTLNVIDRVARRLNAEQRGDLRMLAQQVVALLELRRRAHELRELADERTRAEALLREQFGHLIDDLQAGKLEKEQLLTLAEESRVALLVSERRYRTLWETAPDAVVVLDESGRIQYVNASTTRTFGWQAQELVGNNIEMLQPEGLRAAHRAGMARYLRSRQHTVNWAATEATGLHQRGHEFPLEISFSHTELDGKHMFAGFLRDISERKRDDAERRRLADFLEKSLNEVYVLDVDSLKFSYVNAAGRANLGRSMEELSGMTPVDISPATDASLRALLSPLLDHDQLQVEHETVHRRADGSTYPVQLFVQRVGSDDSRVLLATGLDITARTEADTSRNQLLQQLRQSQKMEALGTLAGGIAHDFNNIVGSVLGNVMLARHDLAPDHPAWASVEQISKGALRARDLVSQILAFSRQQPPKLTSQALQPIVIETAQLLRATLPAGISLELKLPDEPVFVLADATQIEQVLMNLCTNAWHASQGSGTRIEIGVAEARVTRDRHHSIDGLPSGRYADLWVADNGKGMDAATRARIFEPFFTTKPVGEGTGLGLSVAHGIVAAHGGAIDVDSVVDRGATFHVYLPCGIGIGEAARDTALKFVPGTAIGLGRHVLYVDDDELMRLMVERLLQRAGFQVTTCEEGLAAAAAVRQDPAKFDLVVSDYNMPGISGLQLASLLISIRADLPVVIASGDTSDELCRQAAALGVAAVVPKQDTFERIVPVVQQLLGADRSLRE